MRLMVTIKGVPAVIVGYCPSDDGVRAVIVGASGFEDVSIRDIDPPKLPKRLRQKIKHASRKSLGADVAHLTQQ